MSDEVISALLAEGAQSLAHQVEDPGLEAEILLGFVLNKGRTHFRAFPDSPVPILASRAFRDLVQKRNQGMPIAYLTGYREFWSMDFEVSPSVLIPRPETELLVEISLEWIRTRHQPRVLDLGTGSGAIAISLATERPDAEITAIDASSLALALARKNAHRLNCHNVEFIESDWLQSLEKTRRFDLIVSNPPYIPEKDPHLSRGDLRFEPLSALASGPDGLDDIRRITSEAVGFLAPDGSLAFEHGFDQADAVQKILAEAGYTEIQTHMDLQRHPRVTMARYPRLS